MVSQTSNLEQLNAIRSLLRVIDFLITSISVGKDVTSELDRLTRYVETAVKITQEDIIQRRLKMKPLLTLVFVLFAGIASAQVVNPNSVVWDHTDYATASRYDGGYFAIPIKADGTCDLVGIPATSPAMTDNLGKPNTTTGISMSSSLVAKPIGCYVYKVRAFDASGLYSDWSAASGPFVRKPSIPTNPVVK